jgi:hypothetical protein
MTVASTQQLTDLPSILQSIGIEIKHIGSREITGKCPVHIRTVGREDRSPSWSINAETGLWICFSCSARGTLSSLLAEFMGTTDSISIQKFLVNNSFDRLASKADAKPKEEVILDKDAFFGFDRVSDTRCNFKNLDPDLVFRYGVRWNSTNKSWAIPIIASSGRLEGWQEKKTDWVRNYPIGVQKALTLFGIERFKCRTAVLVESPLDVIRFASVFEVPQALASFGAHVSKEQASLLTYVADTIVVAMDNDDAGMASSKKLYKSLPIPRRGIRWWNYKNTSAKDIGDMTDDEIEEGFATSTVIPPWIK